jgi:methylated-DNA-[protein]-cysteine S-methyltransferase
MPEKRCQYDAVWCSPVGKLGISTDGHSLLAIDYLSNQYKPRTASSYLAKEVISQLKSYFSDPEFSFDLPLTPEGTDYQQRVWKRLRTIPAGKLTSYGRLADQLDTGARAIGNACRHNPISIVVPCHRVVAANGPGGYSGAREGATLQRKLWLLEHEGAR